MTRLIKYYNYIIKTTEGSQRHFWLAKQVGQRSWIAMEITTCSNNYSDDVNVVEGNAISIVEKLQSLSDEELKMRMYDTTIRMRQGMFEVLKYGRFSDEKDKGE